MVNIAGVWFVVLEGGMMVRKDISPKAALVVLPEEKLTPRKVKCRVRVQRANQVK